MLLTIPLVRASNKARGSFLFFELLDGGLWDGALNPGRFELCLSGV